MRRPILSSLVLLLIGIVFLLTNFGYLNGEVWFNSFKYWPIVLIFIGLEMLFTKKGSPNLLIVTIILVFVLPFFLHNQFPSFNFNLNFLNQGINSSSTVTIEKKLGTLIGAKLALDLKNGELKIGSLDPHSSFLVQGKLGFSRISKEPVITFDPKAGIASLDIQAGSQNLPLNINASNWELNLSQVIPMDIVAKSSSSHFELDLNKLKMDNLHLELGKTQTTISFAKAGSIKVNIVATEGTVTINIPDEHATQIELPEGASADISTRFAKTDQGYQTDRFDTSSEKLLIKIDPGKAKVVIN